MKTVKVAEATGKVLNFLVAKADGLSPFLFDHWFLEKHGPLELIAYLPSFCRTKTPIESTWLSIEYSTSAICRPCRIGKGRRPVPWQRSQGFSESEGAPGIDL